MTDGSCDTSSGRFIRVRCRPQVTTRRLRIISVLTFGAIWVAPVPPKFSKISCCVDRTTSSISTCVCEKKIRFDDVIESGSSSALQMRRKKTMSKVNRITNRTKRKHIFVPTSNKRRNKSSPQVVPCNRLAVFRFFFGWQTSKAPVGE